MENIPVQTPDPAGWKPTTSTVTAGVIGGATAQLAIFVLGHFGIVLDAATAGALSTLLAVGASYVHPDGGRK